MAVGPGRPHTPRVTQNTTPTGAHPAKDPHDASIGGTLNWLRAGVLGANDGIISTAGLLVGVAAVDPRNTHAIAVTAAAGVVAGAASMALGEYVSVSTQRDTEKALIEKERRELDEVPDHELAELVGIYEGKGLSRATAEQVARELTDHDVLAAHLDAELGIDQDDLTNPWQAAFASAVAFTVGALLPTLAMLLTPAATWRIPVTFVVVLLALATTGLVSARIGRAPARAAVLRVVVGGALGMAVTFGVGHLFGAVTG